MVRRTKADALATSMNILDCAECLFAEQGVSRTTLHHIAVKAGVSRGAIYWHFDDKAALFNAMMERVKMPLESAMQILQSSSLEDPLADLQDYAMAAFRLMENDPRARRVFEIATLKLEYTHEMAAVRERRADMAARCIAMAERSVSVAARIGVARSSTDPRETALAFWALIDGLLRAWMIAPESFGLTVMGEKIIGAHLDALRT
ncbi:TetR family transcriptional regulator [Massilia niastensis]|uniref:TetR family transcriptional regulator n=1 Tax=Massilia niastensis TaxID=544911 RepID=UPI00036DB697|nr:TetR family transcriptional regulator [Massilia niastensis]